MSTLKIVNYDTFKKWLDDVKSGLYDQILGATRNGSYIQTLANFIGVSRNTVSNWYNKDTKPSSEHLNKIFKAFGDKLTYEDLGVKEVDDKKSSSVFIIRLTELMEEKNWDNKRLAEENDVTEGAVSSWRSGRSMPTEEKMIKLAELFGVSTEYLRGTSDVRKIENIDDIILKILNETILETIRKNSPDTIVDYMGKSYTLKELGEKYFDIYTVLINQNLISVMREEAERVIKIYSDYKYFHTYNDIINNRTIKKEKDVLGHKEHYSEFCSIIDIARLNIHKAIDKVFDRFVEQKLQDFGIAFTDIDNLDKYYEDKRLNKYKKE